MKQTAKIKFYLNDEPLIDKVSPTTQRMVDLLKNLPDGYLYKTKNLCEKYSINLNSLKHYTTKKEFEPFQAKTGTRLWWGNPKTIKELKRVRNEKPD